MSIPTIKNNTIHDSALDELRKITQDLKDLQTTLRYASTLRLPESETTFEIENPKRCYAKLTSDEGIVSKHTKTFQNYINQSLKHQNLSL